MSIVVLNEVTIKIHLGTRESRYIFDKLSVKEYEVLFEGSK